MQGDGRAWRGRHRKSTLEDSTFILVADSIGYGRLLEMGTALEIKPRDWTVYMILAAAVGLFLVPILSGGYVPDNPRPISALVIILSCSAAVSLLSGAFRRTAIVLSSLVLIGAIGKVTLVSQAPALVAVRSLAVVAAGFAIHVAATRLPKPPREHAERAREILLWTVIGAVLLPRSVLGVLREMISTALPDPLLIASFWTIQISPYRAVGFVSLALVVAALGLAIRRDRRCLYAFGAYILIAVGSLPFMRSGLADTLDLAVWGRPFSWSAALAALISLAHLDRRGFFEAEPGADPTPG